MVMVVAMMTFDEGKFNLNSENNRFELAPIKDK